MDADKVTTKKHRPHERELQTDEWKTKTKIKRKYNIHNKKLWRENT